MGKLVIHQNLLSEEKIKRLLSVCPFGALQYENGTLDVTSGCKMCKLCVKKGEGAVEYQEEITGIDKSLWRGILVFADASGGTIHRVSYELCGKARELSRVTGHPVYAILIGHNTQENAQTLLRYGVDRVYRYDHPAFADFRIEPYTEAFFHFIKNVKPSSVVFGATDLGRQLAPRVAARCRAGLTADCTVLEMKENTDLVQIRPAFGGNIMAQIISTNTRPQFCTARYKIFNEPIPSNLGTGEILSMEITPEMLLSKVTVLSSKEKPRDVDISEAEVIVALGRGAMDESLRRQGEELARLLGGVLACTRPLVEGNLFDAKHQIGLSGRTVKPKLILCLGISGSVQFAAGMKASDCIVAVNSDPAASIFDFAHYGIVADVNEFLPLLIKKIKEDA